MPRMGCGIPAGTEPGPRPPAASAGRRGEELLAAALSLAGLAVAVALASASDGFYHDDDIGHYIFARDAWGDVRAMWHSWGRPGYNLPTMFVVHYFGIFGCRIFSAVQTAIIAYLAYRIARRIHPEGGIALALAPAFVWVQPLAMTLACTTLTETTAALYMALAIWLYLRGNHTWGSLAAGMLFITRYEAVALAPILAAAVVRDALGASGAKVSAGLKTWWAWASAGAMLAPPAVYMAVVYLANLPPDASPIQFVRNDVSEYGRGAWDHHLIGWMVAGGWGVLALASTGAVCLLRRAWLPAALAAGYVGLHTVIFHYGVVASGGYPRFLVPVCGPVGALAAAGLAAVWRSGDRVYAAVLFGFLAEWTLLVGQNIPSILGGYYAVRAAAGAAVLAVALIIASDRSVRLCLGLAGATAAATALLVCWATWAGEGIRSVPSGHYLRLVAAAAVAGGLASAIAWYRPLQVWLGRAAVAVAVIAAGWQAGVQVRPLTHENDPDRLVVAKALERLKQEPCADNDALTGHVLAGFLRPRNTQVVYSVPNAIERWRAAKPGTLYIWDRKYGGGAVPEDPMGPLHWELRQRGQLILEAAVGDSAAEVFLRLPDAPR